MQEAYLTAFTKLDSHKGEVVFGAWLKLILINKSLTQLMKNNRYVEVKTEVIADVEIEDETIDYKSLNPKNVLNTMQNLKENHKVVLALNLGKEILILN